jgi:hypothetical protein
VPRKKCAAMQFVFQLTRSASNLFARKLNYLMKREKSAANKLKSATGAREKSFVDKRLKLFPLDRRGASGHPPTRQRRLSRFFTPEIIARLTVRCKRRRVPGGGRARVIFLACRSRSRLLNFSRKQKFILMKIERKILTRAPHLLINVLWAWLLLHVHHSIMRRRLHHRVHRIN